MVENGCIANPCIVAANRCRSHLGARASSKQRPLSHLSPVPAYHDAAALRIAGAGSVLRAVERAGGELGLPLVQAARHGGPHPVRHARAQVGAVGLNGPRMSREAAIRAPPPPATTCFAAGFSHPPSLRGRV